jgi:serine/threonine-protein kinase
MAPEQAARTIVDHRADLYTLGVVLYAMLAGHPPFRDETMEAWLRAADRRAAAARPYRPRVDAGAARAHDDPCWRRIPTTDHQTADDVVRRIDELVAPEAGAEAESEPRPASSSRVPREQHLAIDGVVPRRTRGRSGARPGLERGRHHPRGARVATRPARARTAHASPPPPALARRGHRHVAAGPDRRRGGHPLAASRGRGLAPSRPSAPPSEGELARIAARGPRATPPRW